MAYLNEFPKWDSNGRNLDWILEQYSTFNQRLQEIVDEFHSATEQMQSDIQGLETNYQRQLDLFEGRINTLVGEITRKVDSINENIGGYVNTYLTENINTILQDNPVLETKWERVGTVATGDTFTYTLAANKMYEIVYLDYEFNYSKFLVSNNTYKKIAQTYTNIPTTIENELTHDVVICSVPVILPDTLGESINVSLNNLVFSITNNKPNTLTVYVKELI